MFSFKIQLRRLLIGLLLAGCMATYLLFSQERGQSPQPKKHENRQASPYELLAKGVVSSAAFQVQFKSAALRLEIRNLIMGRGETESIPTPSRVLLEVRQGGVTTTINQEKLSRSQGDFWVVDKGSIFTIQNSGEVAVLRAIYIFEGSR
jgi:hypothetical protein